MKARAKFQPLTPLASCVCILRSLLFTKVPVNWYRLCWIWYVCFGARTQFGLW